MIVDGKVRSLQPGDRIIWRPRDKTLMFFPSEAALPGSRAWNLRFSDKDDKAHVSFLHSESDWNSFMIVLAMTSGCSGVDLEPVNEKGEYFAVMT